MTKAVKLDDVARLAGVSPATASRALNGRKGVRPPIRERVISAAQSLGYRPNRAAQQLATGRASVIGLILPSDDLELDPYGASLVQATVRAADEADLGVMLFLSAAEPRFSVRSSLQGGNIDGLIISAISLGQPWTEELLDLPFPTVLIGPHPRRKDVTTIDTENERSSRAAVSHLFDQGCRRIATLVGPLERVDAQRRLAGYYYAHHDHGFEVDESLVLHGQYLYESGRQLGAELIRLRPDGVFAANDLLALGAMAEVGRAGILIPEQMAFIGFDGLPVHHAEGVDLSTVRQPVDELGRRAVEVICRLAEGETVPLNQLVEPELVLAGSSLRRQSPVAAALRRSLRMHGTDPNAGPTGHPEP